MAVLLALAPLPCLADQLACQLVPEGGGPEVSLHFGIDRGQFAPPQSPEDPPRRLRSIVTMGETRFAAEPLLMEGGRRGFWTQERAEGPAMMVIEPEGAAKLTDVNSGTVYVGTCEDVH